MGQHWILDRGFPDPDTTKELVAAARAKRRPDNHSKVVLTQDEFERIVQILSKTVDVGTAERTQVQKHYTLKSTKHPDHPEVRLKRGNLIPVTAATAPEVLARCHGEANHGVEDTWAYISANYFGITKNLVNDYIKACPTCATKRGKVKQRSALQDATNLGR